MCAGLASVVAVLSCVAQQLKHNTAADRYKDWTVQLKATLPLDTNGATRARVAYATIDGPRLKYSLSPS